MPPFFLVRYAARRSELVVNGIARMKPTALPTAMSPELFCVKVSDIIAEKAVY
jgi:hypothetical protein